MPFFSLLDVQWETVKYEGVQTAYGGACVSIMKAPASRGGHVKVACGHVLAPLSLARSLAND